jgi:NTP pyrophosphatase (non-canonical NTP hydrolase)
MTLEAYAAWAASVRVVRSGKAADTEQSQLVFSALSLAGEAGEIADHVKALLKGDDIDRQRLAAELGDAMFHWVQLCAAIGAEPAKVLADSRRIIDARIAKQQRVAG